MTDKALDKALNDAVKRLSKTAKPKPVILARVGERGCRVGVATSCYLSKEKTPYLRTGNGKFSLQRLQWEIHHKGEKIPRGRQISENCRTRGCLNPNHLAPMTLGEIMKVRGNHKKGAANGRAKLTEEQAAIIKKSRSGGGGASRSELAEHFGISVASVQDIWDGSNWGWLEPSGETPVFSPHKDTKNTEEQERNWGFRRLQWASAEAPPRAEELKKLGLTEEESFIRGLQSVLWRDRDWTGRREQLKSLKKIERALEPPEINNAIASTIIQTAGYLHFEETNPSDSDSASDSDSDWRAALNRPTILQGNRPWQELMAEMAESCPCREDAIAAWKRWLTGAKSKKQAALRASVKALLKQAESDLKAALKKKTQEYRASGGDPEESPSWHIHHSGGNSLRYAGITTFPEVALMSAQELGSMAGFGPKTLARTIAILAEAGLKVREEPHALELLEKPQSREEWLREEREIIKDAFLEEHFHAERWWEWGQGDPRPYLAEGPHEAIRALYGLTSEDFPEKEWMRRLLANIGNP